MNLVTAANVLSFVKIRQLSLCSACMIDLWLHESTTYNTNTSRLHVLTDSG